MGNDIKSTIVVLAATVLVSFLCRYVGLGKRFNTLELSWWMVITVAGFIIGNIYVLMLIIIALKLFYLRSDLDKNMLFFLLLLPAIVFSIEVPFPHPGVPLLDMSHLRILSLIILVPLLPKLLEESRHYQNKRLFFDIPLLFIFGREIYQEYLPTYYYENTLITSIKGTIIYILEVVVPYTALAIWVNRDRRLLLVFKAFLIGGLILAIVGIVSAVVNWDIYRGMSFSGMNVFISYYETRGGILRIAATLEHPITFAFYQTILLGMALGWLYWRKSNLLKMGLLLTPILAIIFFTGSRGGWVGAAMCLILFYYFKMPKHTKLVSFTVLLLSGGLMVGAYAFIQSGSSSANNIASSEVDPYGTFEYRKRLFYATLEIIPRYPFFGNRSYEQEPEMQKLMQGQGIIDPVNVYMTFAVAKGLVFLFFIFLVLIRSVRAITRYIESGFIANRRIRVVLGAGMAALLVANLAELVFTSYSGPIIPYLWIMLGIARGMYYIVETREENYQFNFNDTQQSSPQFIQGRDV